MQEVREGRLEPGDSQGHGFCGRSAMERGRVAYSATAPRLRATQSWWARSCRTYWGMPSSIPVAGTEP
jgi:hypothetical protein